MLFYSPRQIWKNFFQAKVESEEAKRKLASFFGECAMLSRLDHPHIVRRGMALLRCKRLRVVASLPEYPKKCGSLTLLRF